MTIRVSSFLMAHPGGRPTVLTPDVIRKLEEAYALDCSDGEACLYANISRSTLYELQKENPEFSNRKALLKKKPFLVARQTMMRGLEEDYEFALKYMERKKKKEFGLRIESNYSGNISISVDQASKVIDLAKEDYSVEGEESQAMVDGNKIYDDITDRMKQIARIKELSD